MSWVIKSRIIDETNMFDALEMLVSFKDLLGEMVMDSALKRTNSFSLESVDKMNELIGILGHWEGELERIADEIELSPGGTAVEPVVDATPAPSIENASLEELNKMLEDMDSGI